MEIMIHSPNCRGCLVKKSRHTRCNYVSFPHMIFISTFFILFPVYTRFFSTLVLLCCCYWDRKCLCNFKHIFYSDRCVFPRRRTVQEAKGIPPWLICSCPPLWNTWPVPISKVTRTMHQKRGFAHELQTIGSLWLCLKSWNLVTTQSLSENDQISELNSEQQCATPQQISVLHRKLSPAPNGAMRQVCSSAPNCLSDNNMFRQTCGEGGGRGQSVLSVMMLFWLIPVHNNY